MPEETKIENWNSEVEEAVDAKIIEELDNADAQKEKEQFEKELDEELGIKPKETQDSDKDTPDKEEKPDPDEDTQVEDEKKDDGKKDSEKDTPQEPSEEEKQKQEEKDRKDAELAREEETKKYAEEYDITVDEAKKDIESLEKIGAKYHEGRDEKATIKELSKALLFLQRRFTASQEMLKATQTPQDGFYDDKMIIQGREVLKDEVVKIYRSEYPKLTNGAEDDAVYEMAKKEFNTKVKTVNEAIAKEIPEKAKQRREEIISNLSADATKFKDDIETMLFNLPDEHVISKNFKMSTVIRAVKGKYYDRDVQKAKQEGIEEGLKMGKEEAVIEGEKIDTPSKSGKQTVDKSSSSTKLTPEQEKEAFELYGDDGLTQDQVFKLYAEQLEAEKKLAKK